MHTTYIGSFIDALDNPIALPLIHVYKTLGEGGQQIKKEKCNGNICLSIGSNSEDLQYSSSLITSYFREDTLKIIGMTKDF